MSILIDKKTRVLVQGITGREGEFHTRQMLDYGTNVVAGVTPGKGGQFIEEGDETVAGFQHRQRSRRDDARRRDGDFRAAAFWRRRDSRSD